MLLESIKTFVTRFNKRKAPTVETQAASDLATTARRTGPVLSSSQATTGAGANPDPPGASTAAFREGQLTAIPPTPGFFPSSHDFVINNPTMISYAINSGTAVLQILAQKRIPGAEVDSSARDSPPKCHPETRKSLRGRIADWVVDPQRHWRMLWILGPAGVGKSAIAQIIGEEFKALGRLGASLFFSRLNRRDDPDGVIPTLAYQLAVKHPEYKRIITQRLADDFTILEKNRRTQFKELIIDPFQTLMTQHASTVQQPLLIILDGLDECKGEVAQCEFIELISHHVRTVKEFPIIWMVCSRPEEHLKYLLSQPDFQVTCKREEILIHEKEAQQDVERFLRERFHDIRQRYKNYLDPDWPSEAHLQQISTASSGLFAFASTLALFVGDADADDPDGQLQICIKFLSGSSAPGAINPFHALDLLYRQILSNVPAEILPTTMRILGMLILYPRPLLSAQAQANFLRIDRATFYRSLKRLHSVLDIPSVPCALKDPIDFYHASFGEYLRDPKRSGSFSIDEGAVHYDIASHSLYWMNCPQRILHQELKWIQSSEEQLILELLTSFSPDVVWRACRHVSSGDTLKLMKELEEFDFGALKRVHDEFGQFLPWLYTLGPRSRSLIHVAEDCPVHHSRKKLNVWYCADNIRVYESSFGSDIARNRMAPFHVGTDGKVCEITLTVMSEAQQDVLHYLQDEFTLIRLWYPGRLDPDWPGDAHLRQLVISSFGRSAFTAIVGRFIGDRSADDPNGQLLKILDAVTLEADSLNPFNMFDPLYRQILSSVPADILPTAMQILGMLVLYQSYSLSIQEQANFLRIDRSTFYRSIERLHPVLSVPISPGAPIHFHYTRFPNYLLSPERSGNFSINEMAVHFDVAIHSLRWMNLPQQALHQELTWTQAPDEQSTLERLRSFASGVMWDACRHVSSGDAAGLMKELEQFDFGALEKVHDGFGDFLRWLYTLEAGGQSHKSLLHVAADCPAHHSRKTLHFTHYTDDAEAYESSFGPDVFLDGLALFHVGKGDKVCEIALAVVDNKRSSTPVSIRSSESELAYNDS